ncbi:MAG TPA: hypothetical protein VHP38_13140 [Ruminiclostridium sp.]|nr:hypothetical protein [Ruminiclostridium sp.]
MLRVLPDCCDTIDKLRGEVLRFGGLLLTKSYMAECDKKAGGGYFLLVAEKDTL